VALAPFDLFVGVITDVLVCWMPPFSVVLTDWLSKTAAEGVGFLSTRLRSASRKAVWIFSQRPLWVQREKYL
jgi:hypothetical protein